MAFYCHTPNDECLDGADCNLDEGSAAAGVWYPARSHWACSSTGFFPP